LPEEQHDKLDEGSIAMATVLLNEQLAPGIYQLTVEGDYQGKAGQFYMLRSWDAFPLLSRPISIHDIGVGSIAFLYRVNGVGTSILSQLRTGDSIQLDGPFGNGFPLSEGSVALVGGGMGIAPLLLAAKSLPAAHVYLGYSGDPFATWAFHAIHSNVTVVLGGSIIDAFDPLAYDTIYACGPVAMMVILAEITAGTNTKLYISVEKRMACGIGACNGCNVSCTNGSNRKACTNGPVFLAEEVNFHDLYAL
jgi:dihydroorotate dehydrogenase electron transfer subunit